MTMSKDRMTKRATSYSAPALEKGLGILEMISKAPHPMNLSEISQGVGRAKSEIFRMVYVLESLGYLERVEGTDGYTLTNRLFLLGMQRPPLKELLELALPSMRKLTEDTRQSCHLVVAADENMVVIARIESPSDLGLAVRIGHHRPILEATSGIVLTAFQPEAVRTLWVKKYGKRLAPKEREELVRKLDAIREAGYAAIVSTAVSGVTDVSAPIMRNGQPIAALAIPYMQLSAVSVSQRDATKALCKVTADLSSRL
ncbi:IclR family transcriptional regulator [Rudaea cellulosilytica]|uniref:IclR family transcriptional regulator n=1 Tax=Rudaea cellulosilytica TaxID=540746 RepID=UPI00035DD190|nr:IclR family transcriptional regulator [Rudaea cellulosilytica]